MKTCERCERERVVAITLDDTIDAGGHSFTAQLPAEQCEVCGQVVIQARDLKLFELRVAVELAKAGIREKRGRAGAGGEGDAVRLGGLHRAGAGVESHCMPLFVLKHSR